MTDRSVTKDDSKKGVVVRHLVVLRRKMHSDFTDLFRLQNVFGMALSPKKWTRQGSRVFPPLFTCQQPYLNLTSPNLSSVSTSHTLYTTGIPQSANRSLTCSTSVRRIALAYSEDFWRNGAAQFSSHKEPHLIDSKEGLTLTRCISSDSPYRSGKAESTAGV